MGAKARGSAVKRALEADQRADHDRAQHAHDDDQFLMTHAGSLGITWQPRNVTAVFHTSRRVLRIVP
jgi:hypothetical protein